MFEIGIALVMNCFILNVYYRNYEMAPWMRRLLLDRLGPLVRIEVPHTRTQHFLDKMSGGHFRELNPLSETTILNNHGVVGGNSGDGAVDSNGNGDISYFPTKSTLRREDHHTIQKKTKISVQNNGTTNDLTYTKANLSTKFSLSLSSDPQTRSDERKILGEDWKLAARILDRSMLIIAVSVGVFSALAIFLQAPRFRQMFIP